MKDDAELQSTISSILGSTTAPVRRPAFGPRGVQAVKKAACKKPGTKSQKRKDDR